jgi:hypothetical protein
LLCGLLDLVAYVAADRVRDFGQGESCDLHDAAHLALRLIDAACDFAEASGKDGVNRASYMCGCVHAYLVKASLFRLSKSWPVWAPLSLLFIRLSDWRVAKTASRAWRCQYSPIHELPHASWGIGQDILRRRTCLQHEDRGGGMSDRYSASETGVCWVPQSRLADVIKLLGWRA